VSFVDDNFSGVTGGASKMGLYGLMSRMGEPSIASSPSNKFDGNPG
jgi:hypothetical protein